MKKLSLLLLFVANTLLLNAQEYYVSTSFHEPATDGLRFIYSEDGVKWDSIQGTFLKPGITSVENPEPGKQGVMRDPSIAVGPDGTFHLVWTSAWRGDPGFGYSHSKDLIHWSEPRFIKVMDDPTTVNVWAPEICYDKDKKQFMISWASCIPGAFPDGQEDHLNNHRLYYTTTKDFKKFSKAQLFIEPGFSCIDAAPPVQLKDGSWVLVFKDNTRPMRNVKVAFGKSMYGPWENVSKPISEDFTEGPTWCKVGDWYYIYYDSYRRYIFGARRTKDFKNFQDVTGGVSVPQGHKHGTIFKAPKQIVDNLKKYNSESVHFTGSTIATPARHDGGLSPVVGVHNIQTMRGGTDGNWLYNHQPMIAFWNDTYYIHYLTDPRSEHEQPGKTMLQTSKDGYSWSKPEELFPPYPIPDGFKKQGMDYEAKDLKSVMHQRVGWYVSKDRNTLVAIGNHGIVLHPKDDPNDGNGVGRVVREVKKDGSLGPIYFIYYNHDFNEKNTIYPYYKKAKNKAFVKACDEILADPMQRMQWAEESDRNDDILPLKTPAKAFSGYTLPDGRKVGLWKHALTSVSADGGNTWRTPLHRAHGFVNSNAKIWGQRLSDGTYATVYNPSEYRWPLAISLSADGLNYTTLNLVTGDVTPERHYGLYKSFGPQYVRGIQECNPQPTDGNLWLSYSMNKEDMWVARVPVPVQTSATQHADENFASYKALSEMTSWNIYSPLKAPVELDGEWLRLSDSEVYDYARVEKVIPATKELVVEFDVKAKQNNTGQLNIEFTDEKGNVASKIILDNSSVMRVKGGARSSNMVKGYKADEIYHVKAVLSQDLHSGVYYVNGKKAAARQFDTPVEAFNRVVFRTGDEFTHPTIETPADQTEDMPRADEFDPLAVFEIANFKTYSSDADAASAVLKYDDFAHYAEKFNSMEDENIVQAIPNSESSEWMKKNIPLFNCPDKQFEEIYYYRWWTLRKHIKRTPVGFGMTEFLVQRSYADRWNLIACAIGHHINETRWLRDQTYLNQILNTWYFGNKDNPTNETGTALSKMTKFSSWNPYAIWNAYKVNADTALISRLLPSLEAEYSRWKSTNVLENGLFWQGDVQDGMEESISGGRKKKYARPTINSYMTANAFALANIKDELTAKGITSDAKGINSTTVSEASASNKYRSEGSALWSLIQEKLWNPDLQFFGTHRGDSLADVREAIGYMPWYCELAQPGSKYDVAWKQLTDEKGFCAPFGLTTAERRHPLFRSHGFGKCEWDGAIWPFATSQTLTALANYLNASVSTATVDEASASGVSAATFFSEMLKYAESQHYRGRPYIGEYLDETTGYWLMGDRERSRYYNHSTFCDLVINGLVGLRPSVGNEFEVNPLIPADKWNYFCLDNVLYHGHNITIIYDKDGQRYHHGKGFQVLVDGILKTQSNTLSKVTVKL